MGAAEDEAAARNVKERPREPGVPICPPAGGWRRRKVFERGVGEEAAVSRIGHGGHAGEIGHLDEAPAAGAQDPGNLGQGCAEIGQVFEDVARVDPIQRTVAKR